MLQEVAMVVAASIAVAFPGEEHQAGTAVSVDGVG
jgi:hypothetical protein